MHIAFGVFFGKEVSLPYHRIGIDNIPHRNVIRCATCRKMIYLFFKGWFSRGQYRLPNTILQFFENNTDFCCQICIRRKNFFRLETNIRLFFSPKELTWYNMFLFIFDYEFLEIDAVIGRFSHISGRFETFSYCNVESCLRNGEYADFILFISRSQIIYHRFFYRRTPRYYNIAFLTDGKFETRLTLNQSEHIEIHS